jgi:hypothetical protein
MSIEEKRKRLFVSEKKKSALSTPVVYALAPLALAVLYV